jgi:hypothetical protein
MADFGEDVGNGAYNGTDAYQHITSFRGYKNKVPEGKSSQRCRVSRKGHDASDKFNVKTSESGLEYSLPNYIPYFISVYVELLSEEDPSGTKPCSMSAAFSSFRVQYVHAQIIILRY